MSATMESAVQHGAAACVAGLQATGAEGNPAQARGAWRCGKRSAFPTSPHPRRRLRTNFKRGATLTIYLVQKIGQVSPCSARSIKSRESNRIRTAAVERNRVIWEAALTRLTHNKGAESHAASTIAH